MSGGRAREAAGALTASLYARHGRMVLGLCRALLRDAADAEDAAQQTFASAHQALLAGGHVRRPAAWLAAIARNECRARIAARRREPLALAHEELVAVAGAQPLADADELSHEVRLALRALPERQRAAVIMRDVYGLHYREVAVALGLSRAAVETLLFRARRRLRVRLRPVAGALVVPFALRDALAQALPGFGVAASAPTGAGVAVGGAGLLGKLGGAPLAAKLASGAVAVGGAGSVIALDSQPPRPFQRPGAVAAGAEQRARAPTLPVAAAPAAGEPAESPGRGPGSHGSGPTGPAGRGEEAHGDVDDGAGREGRSGPGGDDPDDRHSGRSGPSDPSEDETGEADDSSGPGSGNSGPG